jgi:cytochrome c-type biogenesis protein CcmE
VHRPDVSTIDLTPRDDQGAPASRAKRRWAPIVILALVLVAGGVIVTQFLRSAVDYYCNADELGVRAGCEPGRRLRVQGTVDAGSVESANGVTSFTISFNDRTLPVRYAGQPGGMFQECEPVVVHGELVNDVFEGDRVEVKHSNEYEAKNADRIGAAAQEADTCSPPA